MRFAPVLLGVSFVQSALGAALAIPNGKRAVSFGDPDISLKYVSIPVPASSSKIPTHRTI